MRDRARLGTDVASRRQREIWAAALLDPLHDGQLELKAALDAGEKRIVNQANRRAGKSEGTARILAAEAVVRDGYVVNVIAEHLEAPSKAILEREGDRGLQGMLDRIGVPYRRIAIGGSAQGVKAIKFPWGSAFVVHDVAHLSAIDKHKGLRGHVFWGDEAQNIENLATVIDELVTAAGADFAASVLLTGTPGREIGTLFHRASTGSDRSYARVSFYCWDNPLFGAAATPGERWREYLRRSGIDQDRVRLGIDDATWRGLNALEGKELRMLAMRDLHELPEDLRALVKALPYGWQREHLGRWVADGADMVYPTSGMETSAIYWANDAGALAGDRLPGLPTVGAIPERVAALPVDRVRAELVVKRKWQCAVAFDLGFSPDPFAWWAGVYHQDDPVMYEIWSGHEHELMDSAMLARVGSVLDELRSAGLWIAAALVDAVGQRKGTQVDWSWRLAERFPEGAKGVIPPYKANESLQVKAVNVDVQSGQLKALRGSAADIEQRHLQYKPFDPAAPKNREVHKYRKIYLADGTEAVPGDHCMDCRRYVVWWVNHHGRALRVPEAPVVKPITRESQIQALAAAIAKQRTSG